MRRVLITKKDKSGIKEVAKFVRSKIGFIYKKSYMVFLEGRDNNRPFSIHSFIINKSRPVFMGSVTEGFSVFITKDENKKKTNGKSFKKEFLELIVDTEEVEKKGYVDEYFMFEFKDLTYESMIEAVTKFKRKTSPLISLEFFLKNKEEFEKTFETYRS